MTYDSLEVLAGFREKEKLGYPLLRDLEAKHVSAYGILNEQYEPGHPAYGIPHPGVLYVDAGGVVRAKFAVAGYRQRPPFDALLEYLTGMVGGEASGVSGG